MGGGSEEKRIRLIGFLSVLLINVRNHMGIQFHPNFFLISLLDLKVH